MALNLSSATVSSHEQQALVSQWINHNGPSMHPVFSNAYEEQKAQIVRKKAAELVRPCKVNLFRLLTSL